MSKTKFLGIPEGGKRAGWIEMEGGGSAGVGGNNREFIIDVGDGFSSATTYADVIAAIKAGKCPIAYWNAGGSLLKSYGYMVSEADGAVGFVFFHAGSQIGIAVTESGWGAQ